MKTHKIVYKKFGENVTTAASPYKTLDQFNTDQEDINKLEMFCRSYDDNYLVQANLFELKEKQLPDYLNPDYYIQEHYWFDYLFARFDKETTPEKLIYYLLKRLRQSYIDEVRKIESIYNTQKFRSEFRRSLKAQLLNWIEEKENKYFSPFSNKQLDAIKLFNH